MIGLDDVYKVIVAMTPLYFALMLGYGSVRWWKMFTREQCDAINQLVAYFTFPLFTFQFTANADPFKMNYRFIAADALSKVVIVVVLGIWAKSSSKGSYCWTITSFSLTTLTSSLVIGVPLAEAMYGKEAVDLVVQGSVIQAIVWLTLLLLVLEIRSAQNEIYSNEAVTDPVQSQNDLEGNARLSTSVKPSIWPLARAVWGKLAINPNSYACIIGITWACLSNRWNFEMPTIVEGSIQIMSKAGTGTAMFSMGLFMAQQEKVIACGASLTIVAIVLKFIAGPAAMAVCSIAVGLHGDILRVAIIQAALPQSITSFIFAKEYGLHADVLSTAVIFGMLVSLPVLVAYYAILEFIH